MKDLVHLSVVQFVPEPLEPEANLARMAAAVREEREREVVVFPELSTTGYVPAIPTDEFRARLWDASEDVPGRMTEQLGEVARETGTHVVVGFSERGQDGRLYNSIAWIDAGGALAHVHRKVHLFQRESAYFATGERFETFDTELGRVGLQVCYDSKFPEASRRQALGGAELLICIFAYSPDPGVPEDILRLRAIVRGWENATFYVCANRLGREGDDEFVGRSAIAGPTGQVLNDAADDRAPVVRGTLRAADFALAGREQLLGADRRPDAYGPSPERSVRR